MNAQKTPAVLPAVWPRWFGRDAATLHLLLILAMAGALRCAGLLRWSLWYDEVVTMRLAEAPGPAAMLGLIRQIDATRAPLWPLILMGWLRIFGTSDLAARVLVALLGVLTVAAVYAVGRTAFDERTGRWAAWLCALCPPLITYSQEVRMYALLVLLTVVAWWAFLRFRRSATVVQVLGYAALLAALIYTHPLGIFMVAAQGVAYLVVGRHLALKPGRWLAALGLAAAAVLPWVGRYVDHPPEYILPRYPLRFLLGVPIEYIGGNGLSLLPLAVLIGAGLLTMRDRRLSFREPTVGPIVLVWFVAPVGLIYGYSFVGYPIFGPARIHLFVAPAYLLLVARGLAILPRWARLAAVAAFLPLTIHGLATQTYAPGVKADYRALARWLRGRGDERAVVVLHDHDPWFPFTQFEAARYYLDPPGTVVLERGHGPAGTVAVPPGGVLYNAYCAFGASGVAPPATEPTLQTFYGLTITRGSARARSIGVGKGDPSANPP